MKKVSIKQWKKLYDLAFQIYDLAPWDKYWDADLFAIQLNKDAEEKFVSIMGKDDGIRGIAIYTGMSGYSDFCQICNENIHLSEEFLISDQDCIMTYWLPYEELDEQSRFLIKEFNLDASQEKNCLCFRSFEKRSFPISLNSQEVDELIQILEGLLATLLAIEKEKMEWEEDEMVYAIKDEEDWVNFTMPYPMEPIRYPILSFNDSLIQELKKLSKNDVELAIDLHYLLVSVSDDNYERPINPYAFIFYDLSNDQILAFDLFDPEEDEADGVMDTFIAFIKDQGCPKHIYAKNPYVLNWFYELCERLEIDLIEDELEELDEVYEGLRQMGQNQDFNM